LRVEKGVVLQNRSGVTISSPRKLLETKGIRPRKSMGQHFLADPNVAALIVRQTQFKSNDVVLEIGAGLGALTLLLAPRVRHVLAIEPDTNVAAILDNELDAAGIRNVTVIERDILQCDIEGLAGKFETPLQVLGNLPYHISSQVLIRLIHFRQVIDAAFLMFQKEVTDRLTAGPGTKRYGRISVLIQYCAKIRPSVSVAASAFFPRPKVDSQVVRIEFLHPVPFPADNERLFSRVVGAAFGKRRKTLRNALLGGDLGLHDESLLATLKLAGIDSKRRAETLTVNEFVHLSNLLQGADSSA
jgi:16S rRNA (adenine1518-N6/adenine1519-N6)-dimethyltransferase